MQTFVMPHVCKARDAMVKKTKLKAYGNTTNY